MNRGEQLTAGYKKASVLEKDLRGTRHWIKASLLKKEAVPGDIYSVSIPPLTANECIVPDTMALSFKFNNSNTKSWFLNNLGRLLVDQLCIKVQGVQVYQNTGESMLEVYKDLWRSDVDRENRQQFGIANENVRKLISKDDSADKAAKLLLLLLLLKLYLFTLTPSAIADFQEGRANKKKTIYINTNKDSKLYIIIAPV